jgi:hypothetical protein
MVIAHGSKVVIDNYYGVLAEDVNINLKSNFKSLLSDLQGNEVTDAISLLGAASRHITGRGFSAQCKQFTMQTWDKTDPARFNLNVDFQRTINDKNKPEVSGEKVMEVVKYFCKFPLPNDIGGGILEPPGPSAIAGLGIDELLEWDPGSGRSGFLNVTIGSMKFSRLLMESAEPTFNKFTDDSGYPISCRIVFSFVSLWAATKQSIDDW